MPDSKKFVATGEYYGEKFRITHILDSEQEFYGQLQQDENGNDLIVVNGAHVEVEPGAKEGTFTIRETPEMYAERLLAEFREALKANVRHG